MIKAVNFTKKDEINSMSSTPLQKVKGETVHVLGAAITERPDEETGEAKKVGLLVTEEFGTLSTISGTAIKGLDMIIDYLTDLEGDESDEQVHVHIKSAKSNSNREFITLEIV